MVHVVLQPSANQASRTHYRDTIEEPVQFGLYSELVDIRLLDALWNLFPLGAAPMWGVTPGINNVNVAKYDKPR